MHNVTLKNANDAQKSVRFDFFRSIFWTSKYMGHNFSILTDRKSKNAPATQKFYLYFSMIWQNSCDVKTWNTSFIRTSSHTRKNIQEVSAEIIFQDIDILSHPTPSCQEWSLALIGTHEHLWVWFPDRLKNIWAKHSWDSRKLKKIG